MAAGTAEELIGCVATVPHFKKKKGLGSDESFEEQYKNAIRGAVNYAIELNRPLYLQPLGIGVYGWVPITAAKLFNAVFEELDPNNKLDITIPIHSPNSGPDKVFMNEINKLTKERLLAKSSGVSHLRGEAPSSGFSMPRGRSSGSPVRLSSSSSANSPSNIDGFSPESIQRRNIRQERESLQCHSPTSGPDKEFMDEINKPTNLRTKSLFARSSGVSHLRGEAPSSAKPLNDVVNAVSSDLSSSLTQGVVEIHSRVYTSGW